MKNKKSVMAFSGFLIVFFHLWICEPGKTGMEAFIKQTAYIGVDMFFFLSGFSLATREISGYGSFVWKRFQAVYVKFILFAIVACFYGKWKLLYFVKVICGMDLFQSGGGGFLWFLPGIMLFYIAFPLFQAFDKKNRTITGLVTVLMWAGVAYFVTRYTAYTQLFILWNRIPVFLAGYYFSINGEWWRPVTWKLVLGLVLTVAGGVLLYLFGYGIKLQYPFTDMFYVMVLPVSIGLVLLISFVPEVRPVIWVGSSTLELYGVQMIFGYNVANKLLKISRNIVVTNVCTLLFVMITAVSIHYAYEKLLSCICHGKCFSCKK